MKYASNMTGTSGLSQGPTRCERKNELITGYFPFFVFRKEKTPIEN